MGQNYVREKENANPKIYIKWKMKLLMSGRKCTTIRKARINVKNLKRDDEKMAIIQNVSKPKSDEI